jgi:biopolymer transport protein ExbB
MLQVFLQGGIMMYPLLLCSIWALTIIIWKWLSLRNHTLIDETFMQKIYHSLKTNGMDATLAEVESAQTISSKLIATVIKSTKFPREEGLDRLKAALNRIAMSLEKHMNILHSLITIAPMIGLLGTVLGLMEIFKGIASAVTGDPSTMYAGISVALINTVMGLAIAIPCAFFYQYFSQRIDAVLTDIEDNMMALLDFCRHLEG